MEQVVTELTS